MRHLFILREARSLAFSRGGPERGLDKKTASESPKGDGPTASSRLQLSRPKVDEYHDDDEATAEEILASIQEPEEKESAAETADRLNGRMDSLASEMPSDVLRASGHIRQQVGTKFKEMDGSLWISYGQDKKLEADIYEDSGPAAMMRLFNDHSFGAGNWKIVEGRVWIKEESADDAEFYVEGRENTLSTRPVKSDPKETNQFHRRFTVKERPSFGNAIQDKGAETAKRYTSQFSELFRTAPAGVSKMIWGRAIGGGEFLPTDKGFVFLAPANSGSEFRRAAPHMFHLNGRTSMHKGRYAVEMTDKEVQKFLKEVKNDLSATIVIDLEDPKIVAAMNVMPAPFQGAIRQKVLESYAEQDRRKKEE